MTDRPHVSIRTTQPQSWGHGWLSGVFAVLLGALGLGAVLCLRYPDWLTMPELRARYPLVYIRAIIHLVLVASFLLATASVWLRHNKALGVAAIAFVLAAALLGGSQAPVGGGSSRVFVGLDWFLLNLILYSVVYVPLERLFALHPDQPVLRRGWRTDLTYFFMNSLMVQATTLLTLQPAMVFFDWARISSVVSFVSSMPMPLQVIGAILVADLAQYWVHRLFHVVPALWRIHSVHHSAESMDWLAGSRLHLVDAVVTRALTYVPIYVLGFSQTAIAAYVIVVVIQATFIHANVRWRFRPIRAVVATPAFHHWHHSAERQAADKNFAVHTPLWDRLFGTYYLPDRWPSAYGLSGGSPVPDGWLRQLLFPFRRRPDV